MRGDAEEAVLWVPVGEVGEVRMGKQLSPGSRAAAKQFPYLRVANVLDGRIDYSDVNVMGFSESERRTYALRHGDVLLNEGQSLELVGRSAIYEGSLEEMFFQNTLVRFRPGPEVVSKYAQAIFSRWRSNGIFAAIAKQTTSIAHLGGERFARLSFPLISLGEQQRIVDILDAAESVERELEAELAKLEAARTGLLLESLAPLLATDPVEGWERFPLAEVVPSTDYGISEALTRDSRGVPTLRMNNLKHGKPDLSEMRYCPTGVPERLMLRAGDVLFNRTNSIDHVGRAGIWGCELPNATFASYLVRLNPDTRRILPEYLVEWLQHPIIRQRVKAIATVAVQQVNVNPSRLRELMIDFPADLSQQARIVAALAAIDLGIDQQQSELRKLQATRQGLISDLLG